MASKPAFDRPELFVRYEAALDGLVQVPGRLEIELASAKTTFDAAVFAAATAARTEEERLVELRRTMTSRFGESAKALQAVNVLAPRQVRPTVGQGGDAKSLAAAISAQQEAEGVVAREARAAANAAKQQAVDDRARAAAGRDATAALKKRQEQVRKAKRDVEAEAQDERLAEEERAKRSYRWFVGGVALLVVLVVAVVLLLA